MGTLRSNKDILPIVQLLVLLVFKVAAYSVPTLEDKSEYREVTKLGERTDLKCLVKNGAGDLFFDWKKDGQALKSSWDRFRVSLKNGNLRIKDTQMSDSGRYTCFAIGGHGSVSVNYTLLVLDEENQMVQEGNRLFKQSPNEDLTIKGFKPYFERREKMEENRDLLKPRGSTLRLSCRASGNPQPELTWYKNSQLYNHKKSTLIFTNLSYLDDGDYTCVARNRLGQTNFTYHLVVAEKIREPRLIAPHPLTQSVVEGHTVSFQCFIESEVDPQVKWLKRVESMEELPEPNITLLESNQEKFRVLKDAGVQIALSEGEFLNKLVIPNIHPRDAGKYICLAINREGRASRSAILQVKARPSEDSSDDLNLPFFIGVPSCAVLIILLVVFLMQRNKACCCNKSTDKVPRTPVPPTERQAYYYSNCHPPQTVNPLLASRDKLPKTPTPSVDMTGSEFSSVSRSHHNHHYFQPHSQQHMNYGY